MLYHFTNFKKEYKVESDSFNHEISVGQMVKKWHTDMQQLQQGEAFNGKSYFVDVFGNKVNLSLLVAI